VNYGENGKPRDLSYSVPPLLARIVDAIRDDEAALVGKNAGHQLEVHSVLFPVRLVFRVVPFESHVVYTYCSTLARLKSCAG
jgi:hypothetical protein